MFRKQNTATVLAYSFVHSNGKLMDTLTPPAPPAPYFAEPRCEHVSKKHTRRDDSGGHGPKARDREHKSTRIEIESAQSVIVRAKAEPEPTAALPAPDAPVKVFTVPDSVSVREWKQEYSQAKRRRSASESIMRAMRSVIGGMQEPVAEQPAPQPGALDIMLARVSHELEFIITYSADAIARNCALRAHSDISRWRTEQGRG